jgi:hypothetical protein
MPLASLVRLGHHVVGTNIVGITVIEDVIDAPFLPETKKVVPTCTEGRVAPMVAVGISCARPTVVWCRLRPSA